MTVGLLERIAAIRRPEASEERYSFSDLASDSLVDGNRYPLGLNTTYGTQRAREITTSLPSYTSAIKGSPPAFAAQMMRAMVLSQARFTFRTLPSSPNPRRTSGSEALALLEKPWPGATTGELLARMEWHAGLAGNAFVLRQQDRLRVLRPDWVTIVYGSEATPERAAHALDGTLLGYLYCNGGALSQGQFLLPSEVAHWSPIPDPLCAGIGMSWLTPAVRDLKGDQVAAQHKVMFFENAASPNLVIKGLQAANKPEFDRLVDMLEDRHKGVKNAFKTLYLTSGADATVIGSDFKQMDFKAITGSAETRIAFLSRVPAALLGISEGLSGSSLNAGNFAASRRIFTDTWVFPMLQDIASALASVVDAPAGSELWFDTQDIPLLREDAKDAAEITKTKVATIGQAVRDGFTAESAVAAVNAQDTSLLVHSGLVSVQLLPPGTTGEPSAPEGEPEGNPDAA